VSCLGILYTILLSFTDQGEPTMYDWDTGDKQVDSNSHDLEFNPQSELCTCCLVHRSKLPCIQKIKSLRMWIREIKALFPSSWFWAHIQVQILPTIFPIIILPLYVMESTSWLTQTYKLIPGPCHCTCRGTRNPMKIT
jgi:hypothetical protein